MAGVNLLQTRALSRHFGGLQAVREVDFALPRGQIRALIGPNGAGKTTFVSMLCGRIGASGGQVFFEGRDITALPAHERIRLGMAYTFQITSVFGDLSVFENVALAVQARLVRDRSAGLTDGLTGEVMAALERVGLAGHAEQRAGALAYGHQRLLEIAMGLGQRPKLLILDEPTQGLSDSEIEGFIALIKALAGQGDDAATVLLIEHNIPVVMALAERITVLESGAIIAEGSPAEIHADARVQAAYLGGGGA